MREKKEVMKMKPPVEWKHKREYEECRDTVWDSYSWNGYVIGAMQGEENWGVYSGISPNDSPIGKYRKLEQAQQAAIDHFIASTESQGLHENPFFDLEESIKQGKVISKFLKESDYEH